MNNSRLDHLINSLDEIEGQIPEIELGDLDDKICELEEQIENAYEDIDEEGVDILRDLKKRISRIRRESGLYDEETELDMMFPDRHDEDFDEDSMSYGSIFGDD